MVNTYSAADKARILSELSRSGLSVSAFSRQSDVSDSSLWKWRKEARTSSDMRAEFIEVGKDPMYYELEKNGAVLKIPSTESPERIWELMSKLC